MICASCSRSWREASSNAYARQDCRDAIWEHESEFHWLNCIDAGDCKSSVETSWICSGGGSAPGSKNIPHSTIAFVCSWTFSSWRWSCGRTSQLALKFKQQEVKDLNSKQFFQWFKDARLYERKSDLKTPTLPPSQLGDGGPWKPVHPAGEVWKHWISGECLWSHAFWWIPYASLDTFSSAAPAVSEPRRLWPSQKCANIFIGVLDHHPCRSNWFKLISRL